MCPCVHCSPYDTLEEVIGLRGTPGHGSLIEWGVRYRELPLKDNMIDWEALATAIVPGEGLCLCLFGRWGTVCVYRAD